MCKSSGCASWLHCCSASSTHQQMRPEPVLDAQCQFCIDAAYFINCIHSLGCPTSLDRFWRVAILGCRSIEHTYRTQQQAEIMQRLLEQHRNGDTMCASMMVGKVRNSFARFLLDMFDELSGVAFKEI